MQSIKTILMFEVMYRHKVLGYELSEIENQLKNYPTQDAQDLLRKLRGELSQDSLSKEPDNEDDVSVTEAQEQGDKAAYQAHFNKMLGDYGVTNIGELPKEKRAEFFRKIDQHWKSDKEAKKKVNEEIEWTEEIFEEFVIEFSEFADILTMIKKEIEVLEEASGSKKTTVTKITRQTKIDRTIGNLAMQLAKAKNDPMYKKFKKFKTKWMTFKERIQKKYGPRVRTAARTGGGIGHLIKKEKAKQSSGKSKKK